MVSLPSHRWRLPLTAFAAIWGVLISTLTMDAAAAGSPSGRVAFAGSIKEVPTAQATAPAAPHRATMVRAALRPEEEAASMEVEVALRMRNFAELQRRVSGGELISRAEMAEKYFPTAGDYRKVTDWLASQGLAVTRTDDNRLAVFASGTVDLVAMVFKVSFARVAVDGAEYSSAITAPSLPADIARPVLGIHGLQPHLRRHRMMSSNVLRAQETQGYTPSQILQAYDATRSGMTGKGQTIAVVGDAFPSQSDVTSFWSQAGVSQLWSNIQLVPVDGGPSNPAVNDQKEITLDTEWSSSIAPGAVVRVYGMSDLSNTSFDKTFQQVYADLASNPSLHQFSSSYGGGEEDNSNDYLNTEAQYMANLAGAGVSLFAASGDNGAYADGNHILQVTYPASDPSVTGVGGTSLENLNSTPPTEYAWSDSGGGASGFFPRPSWQTGKGMAPGTTRLVPDVSASADPTFGAFTVFQGISQVVGGTSWATPTWAGFCALINQAVGGSTGIGALNPKIYPLLLTPAFRDVTSGSNGTYSAGIGYDEVTGIGVPDVANLISVLTSGGSAPSIISQLGNQAIVLGQDAAFSVAADGQNPLTYQWQRMPGGASAWINLSDGGVYSGSSTDNLVVSGVTYAMNGDHFQCLVSNSLGSAVSSPADLLQVNPVGVTTLAGLPGDAGYANGTFHAALFNSPGAVRTDASGNIYVADNENDVIRKITPGGTVTTIAGTPGQSGSSDGAATGGALFNDPSGVAVDASGNVYVADGGNYTVRKISGGMVTTLAGLAGSPGSADGTGSAARFQDPQNIAINRSTGNLYVPDGTGDTIRMVTPGGAVTTIAGLAGATGTSDGTGSGARFNNPTGIAVDNSGNLFVTDYGNNSIREVSPGGVVATIAGSTSGVSGGTDGAGTSARFNSPAGIAVDSAENLYVADSANDTIREISPSGQVSTIAGSARIGDSTDGLGANARFNTPDDIAIDGAGTLYIADNVNNTIRRFVPGTLAAPQIQTQPSSATVSVGQNAAFSVSASGSPPLSYQWQRMPAGGATFVDLGDGGAYSGSAAATLTVSGVTAGMGGDQFQCVVTNNAASVTSSVATLSVPSSPVITSAPQTQSALTGTSLTLSVAATGGDLSYQWQFNGANISGATAPTYSLSDIQASSAGTYSVTVSNSLGSTSGTVLTLTVQASSTRLVNLSARANVGTGSDVLIVGFYIGGSGSRDVLLRGDGPALALAPFNLSGVLGQPVMTLNDSGGNVITGDTGWGNSPTQPTGVWAGVAFPVQATSGLFTELGAFQLPADSADSAFEIGLGSGGYTSIISGANATSGIALAEIYDADYISDANPGTRLVNISARAPVGTGNNILIAGFYVSGTGTETILMRGIGPTLGLAPFNVSGVLTQPVITLYDSKGNVITSNTGWGNGPSAPAGVWAGVATVSQATASVFTQVGAFQLAAGSSDSAMVVTLPAGQGYTLEVGGANGTTGVALAELYEVP